MGDGMAKDKRQKKLYSKMRSNGVRKRTAKELSQLPSHVSKGRAPKAVRETVDRLESIVDELRAHTTKGDRRTAARKAARTRGRKARQRSAAATRGARARAKR
jgi:hypothetical protein